MTLSSGAATAWIWGAKGNDSRRHHSWSPEAERVALAFPDDECRAASWGLKRARITNMRRVYGNYIVYECLFDGPLRRNGPGEHDPKSV